MWSGTSLRNRTGASGTFAVALKKCFEFHGKRLAQTLGWNIAQQGYDTAVMSPHPVRLHRTATDPFATCATV